MNPLFQFIVHSVRARRRTCPSCKRHQVVAQSEVSKTVRCRHCGASIPPPKDRR